MLPHIRTTDGVTILVRGRPIHVAHNHKQYDKIVNALLDNANDKTIYDLINAVRAEVERVCKLSETIEYAEGVVRYMGNQLHGYAVDKLVTMIHAGKDVKALTNFLEKLQMNPSNQTVENLYQFLEYGKIPINENGNFLVYKAVRADFKDIHSGTYDNSIGAVCEMARRAVNDNRHETCSHGLHVCSFEYLPHFAHAQGHVMVCEVDPSDVVSIPVDYNNTKMRVCRYKVIGEVEDYYREHKNVLSDLQVWDEAYIVEAREADQSGWTDVENGSFDDLDDAIDAAKSEMEFGGDNLEQWFEVRVLNSSGVMMWHN